jgi:hypothetical protein
MPVRDVLASYNRQALQEGRHARLLLRMSLLAAVDHDPPALARAEELLGHAFAIGSAPFQAVLHHLSEERLLAEVRVAHEGVLVAWPPGAREVLAHPRSEQPRPHAPTASLAAHPSIP